MKLKQWPIQSSQHTVNAKETEPVTDTLVTWNKSVSGKQTRQETNNQNSDRLNAAAICAADVEQISIPLANNIENKTTEIMIFSKSTANASGSCKRYDTDVAYWCTWQISTSWKHTQWLVNTSLLKVIWRGICLCKITYPVIYRLTLNKSDLYQRNTILNIYAMIFNLSNKNNCLW